MSDGCFFPRPEQVVLAKTQCAHFSIRTLTRRVKRKRQEGTAHRSRRTFSWLPGNAGVPAPRGRAAVLSPPRGNPGRFSGGQPLGGPGLQGRRTGGAEHRLVTGCRGKPRPPVLPAWLRLFLPHPGWSRTGTGGRPTPGVKDAVRFVRRTGRRFTGTYKQEPNNRI